MQSTGGFINDLLALCGTVYFILLIHGIARLPDSRQVKWEESLHRRRTLYTVIAHGLALFFVIRIFFQS
jgi:hypothetical protein